MRVAVAKRGVAVVVIPGDVALKPLPAKVPPWILPSRPIVRPSDADVASLASILNGAARVTLMCVRDARVHIRRSSKWRGC